MSKDKDQSSDQQSDQQQKPDRNQTEPERMPQPRNTQKGHDPEMPQAGKTFRKGG
jgi:hypothetical protein